MNILSVAYKILKFIDDSSILSGIVVSIIIGFYLVSVFRKPKFSIILDLIMKRNTNKGVLDFSIVNHKKFMSYDADKVFFFLYIPTELLSVNGGNGERIVTKEFFLTTKDGDDKWNPLFNIRDRYQYNIGNVTYYLIRGLVKLDIYPDRRTHFLRISGDFYRNITPKMYYWFSTEYGIYPRFIKSKKYPYIKRYKGKFYDAEAGLLPYSVPMGREKEL